MITIKPIKVSTGNLVSSTAALSSHAIWVTGSAYAVGDTRYWQGVGMPYPHDYEALAIIGAPENAFEPQTRADLWLDLGASNRYKMFDEVVGTATTSASTLVVKVKPNMLYQALTFFNLVAASVRVQLNDDVDGLVYDSTINLFDVGGIDSWFTYTYSDIGVRLDECIFLNLPTYPTAEITITIDNAGSPVSCGVCVIGPQKKLGTTVLGSVLGLKSYSNKGQDDFGNFEIVEGAFSKTFDYDCVFDTNNMNFVQRYFTSIKDQAVVFIGSPTKPETIVYGFYDDFSVGLTTQLKSEGIVRVVGLV